MHKYLEKYAYKVKSIDELLLILNHDLNASSTIMCHGVFDVVHPGHLRHLSFAKSKADVLIVSVTSDSHIKKGTYRPHVPENIRALNLAALEMVDYVIIDQEDKPISNIEKLKPNFFAKGFEYSNSTLGSATDEEQVVLASYGGQMIFTPGDFVLSSSALINDSAPNLKLEKLITLLQSHHLSFEHLENSLENLGEIRVHVVGDTIIDVFVETSMLGGQTKTPTLSVKYISENRYMGGAAIVAKHLKAAGAHVVFTTILGDDDNAKYVKKDLSESHIKLNLVSEIKKPTTEKKLFICEGHRLLKIDTLENSPCSDSSSQKIASFISQVDADVIIFSDFRHGVFHKKNIPILIDSIPSTAIKIADSQVASRWGNICDFKNFDLITPNEKEARFSTADQDSTIGPLASKLYDLAQCKNLILKLGERGCIALEKDDSQKGPRLLSLDSFTNRPIDPVGAGDALIAYSALVLQKTKSLSMAMTIGMIAASCETEINGNVPITVDAVRNRINELKHLLEYSQQ